ncbi:MAG: DNA/RNA nuclease SfsA [Porticoccaceae bacterium]
MKVTPPLEQGFFRRRYQRFFADVELDNGQTLTIHCANSGSMKNCQAPGQPCWFSRSDNPTRRLPGTLEIVTTEDGHLAGVNTSRPNKLVEEAIVNDVIGELQGYGSLRREVRYGQEKSRIDLLLENDGQPGASEKCFIEVKNVTLAAGNGLALFPDAVTLRGAKHLRELMAMVAAGHRAVLVFCVQLTGVDRVGPADAIDAAYGRCLREAVQNGVEVLAYGCELSPREIRIANKLRFVCP